MIIADNKQCDFSFYTNYRFEQARVIVLFAYLIRANAISLTRTSSVLNKVSGASSIYLSFVLNPNAGVKRQRSRSP